MKSGMRSWRLRRMVTATVTVAALVVAVLAAPVRAENPSSYGFSDLTGDEWYAEAVLALAEKGIVLRSWDGSLNADGPVTRAQLAFFLLQALRLPQATGQPFFDVRPTDWYAGAVGALFQRGLVRGTNPLLFLPNQAVSKEEAAATITRCLAFAQQGDGSLASLIEQTKRSPQLWLAALRDRPLIAVENAPLVAAAYRLGILPDPEDGWYFPRADLTRAEFATMLYRAFFQPVSPRVQPPAELPAESTYTPLATGAKGPLVRFLETRLTALRYPCGPVDGVYDYRTRDAVMAFEKVERLKRDGKVSTQVWEKLLTAQTPKPRKSGLGTRCEVDLSRQVLFMITDNKVTKVVHISSGRHGTRTGHFTIQEKYKGWVAAVTVTGWMYYPSYVVSKTAIHGYKSVPPYPASHGCVRVPVWTAVDLFYELPTGTVVDIYY